MIESDLRLTAMTVARDASVVEAERLRGVARAYRAAHHDKCGCAGCRAYRDAMPAPSDDGGYVLRGPMPCADEEA